MMNRQQIIDLRKLAYALLEANPQASRHNYRLRRLHLMAIEDEFWAGRLHPCFEEYYPMYNGRRRVRATEVRLISRRALLPTGSEEEDENPPAMVPHDPANLLIYLDHPTQDEPTNRTQLNERTSGA